MTRRHGDVAPPSWTEQELDQERQRALTVFVSSGGTAGRTYEEIFRETQPIVERLFEVSNNLLDFEGAVFQREHALLAAARYLAGPPISKDDLETFVGSTTSRRRLADDAVARRVADILRTAWDPIRFPWLIRARNPTPQELTAAILWTAGIWSAEKTRTRLRNDSSRRQEDAAAAYLQDRGFEEAAGPRLLVNLEDLERTRFLRHASLGGEQGSTADLAIRLNDGRLLALECKVSNSSVNSIKRLIHETGHKAAAWRVLFGNRVICGAVLAGVYKLGNLLDAQNNHGVTIFWEHDLTRLGRFLADTTQ